MVGVGYDSNGSETETSNPDRYLGLTAGVDALWSPVTGNQFSFRGLGDVAIGRTLQSREQSLGEGRARWRQTNIVTWQDAEFKAHRHDMPVLPETGHQARRHDLTGHYLAGWQGARWDAKGGVVWQGRQHFDGRFYEPEQRDSDQVTGQVEAGWRTGTRSHVAGNFEAGELRYRHSDQYPDGKLARALGSWRFGTGERSTLDVRAGAVAWRFASPWNSNASDDEGTRYLEPEAAADFEWRWIDDDHNRLLAGVAWSHLPAVEANLARALTANALIRTRAWRTGVIFAGGGWTRTINLDPTTTADPAHNGWSAMLGSDLFLSRGFVLRAGALFLANRGGVANDYNRVLINTQVTFIY